MKTQDTGFVRHLRDAVLPLSQQHTSSYRMCVRHHIRTGPQLHMGSEPTFLSPESYLEAPSSLNSGYSHFQKKSSKLRFLVNIRLVHIVNQKDTTTWDKAMRYLHNVTNLPTFTEKHSFIGNRAYFCIAMGGFGGQLLLQVKESISVFYVTHTPIHGSWVYDSLHLEEKWAQNCLWEQYSSRSLDSFRNGNFFSPLSTWLPLRNKPSPNHCAINKNPVVNGTLGRWWSLPVESSALRPSKGWGTQ